MTAQHIAEALGGRPANGGFMAKCPAHDDRNPSLSIHERDGKVLLHCHAGCSQSEVIAELRQRGLWEPNGHGNGNGSSRNGKGRGGRIVATYEYVDEDGKVLFEVVRFEPKSFQQRRPIVASIGGATGEFYVWGTTKGYYRQRPNGHYYRVREGEGGQWFDDVRQVLFRLPRVIANQAVCVCEGEKDVLALEAMGFTATCNAGGAKKWREEHAKQLAGKEVFIFPDNDKPGAEHAEKVAKSLLGIAKEIRIVRVPVGKDVSDWIESGATQEAIAAAIEAAPIFSGGIKRQNAKRPAKSADWYDRLILSKEGVAKPILANAITALREAPEWEGVLAFNEFSLGTVMLKPAPWSGAKPGDWTDHEDRMTANWLQHQRICVSVDVAGQAVQVVAKERRFHPVRQYLEGLQWDGIKRIDNWLSSYLGAEDTEYSRAVGSRWLISAVARIYQPGAKADHCLILEGPQGLGKSTALRTLAGPWFADEIADLGSKDAAMQTRGVWIIEIAELDAVNRSEVSRIKAFLSRNTDRFRPPYGKHVIESPRQCVFAGTVNHSTYLRDETGGRRFWPVACGSYIRLEELARDRDQLWAEAVHRYRNGAKWWLESVELNQLAEEEQSARYEGDPWEELIAAWLEDPRERLDEHGHPVGTFSSSRESTTVSDILTHCLCKPVAHWTQADKNRVGRCLRNMGWQRYRARAGAALEWRFRRGAK